MAATSLVVFALASAPAGAHGGHNIVAPLAAFIAFGALMHHNHDHHYGYKRRHHGHGHGHGHHRRHSYSHGGYHKPRHKRHKHW
jgi:hypothetical protein